jgi:hypothetical protein
MKRFIQSIWPIVILIVLECILIATNFTPNTNLVGWDNMYPELNFSVNIQRTLTSVWQEYRGLGYMDGMSHAANLVHYLFLWFMSVFLPQQILRYFYVFFTHLVGGIGLYMLLLYLLPKKQTAIQWLALAGAIFYQYCFATVQMYFLPFEVFVTHFAALPWLIYSALTYLDIPNKKHACRFALISLLATPQAHVPTVFLVYLGILTLVLIGNAIATKLASWKSICVIICITFFINAFWGLPFAYSTFMQSKTITESKNNQIATEDIYMKNHQFGDLTSTALMKSFSLTYTQYDYTSQTVDFMMKPWRTYITSPLFTISGWIIFGLTIFGLLWTFLKSTYQLKTLGFVYGVAFIAIGNDIPVIGNITVALQKHIPLFTDVFRFVYTKFFIPYALTTGIFVGIGVYALSKVVSKVRFSSGHVLLSVIVITLVLTTSYPSFTGSFFYPNLKVAIPKEYTDVFTFFEKQPPSERVLIYPMPWYWAWTQYRWGSIGSGFTWFGIKQPTIDRAFDPWSNTNETVYWEFTQAIYEKNSTQLLRLFEKYHISWIMIDENIMHAVNDKALYLNQFNTIIGDIPTIQKQFSSGRISIYHITLPDSYGPVEIAQSVPNVGPLYAFTDHDEAIQTTIPYLTDTTKPFDLFFPFRSLFTGREESERAVSIKENETSIQFGENEQRLTVNKEENIVFDSATANILQQPPKSCNPLQQFFFTHTTLSEQNILFERYTSIDSSNCVTIDASKLSQRNGYLIALTTRHIKGRRLSLSITNNDTDRTFLETYVTSNNLPYSTWHTSYFIIPTMDTFGLGYTITLDSLSIGREQTINDIARIRLYTLPYQNMIQNNIRYTDKKPLVLAPTTLVHPNPALYLVTVPKQISETTFILNQSYDSGWHAFLFGKKLKQHVLINNWANGWNIDSLQSDATIVIVFLPQLLQWFGFLLIPLSFLLMIRKRSL